MLRSYSAADVHAALGYPELIEALRQAASTRRAASWSGT